MDTLKRALASKLLKIKAIKLQPDNPRKDLFSLVTCLWLMW